MQFLPDQTKAFTRPEEFEHEFGIAYFGPGTYLTNNYTILAVCPNRTRETYWHQKASIEGQGELIEVHVWNIVYSNLTLSTFGEVPNRMDHREA